MQQEGDAGHQDARTWNGSRVVIVLVALLALFLAVVILLSLNGGGHDMDDMDAMDTGLGTMVASCV